MGGSHETKVDDIRVHENGGEVHLHDDKASLKVAVPIPAFKDKLAQLDDPAATKVTIDDATRNTRAILERVGGDVRVSIEKVSIVGKGLQALKNFVSKI